MNKTSKVLVLLFAVISMVMLGESAFAQRSTSSSTAKKNSRPSKPVAAKVPTQTPEISQQAPKSDIFYDFDRLSASDTFRNIPWGASKQQILEKDISPRKEVGDDYLVLTGQLGKDINVDISYFFWRGHFIKGTYLTTDSYKDFSGYLEKYDYIRRNLVEKYGQPKIFLSNYWSDVTYKNRPDKWLLALSLGHVRYIAYWQKNNIVIGIELGSVNSTAAIKIEYFIDNFDSEMQQVDDSDILRDL